MPVYRLTDQSDDFDSDAVADWPFLGAIVFAREGDDEIRARGTGMLLKGGDGDDHVFGIAHDSVLRGGEGDDLIEVGDFRGATGNRLFGGLGDDTLAALGNDNRLDGGEGDDLLVSDNTKLPPGFVGGTAGSVMVGGPGEDRYELRATNTYALDDDGDGALGEGDVIRGFIDEIRDYGCGEVIDLGEVEAGTLGLIRFPPEPSPGSLLLTLGAGSYAALRGDLTAPGQFEVDSENGQDLLIVYQRDAFDEPYYGLGAVALHDVTSLDAVTFA